MQAIQGCPQMPQTTTFLHPPKAREALILPVQEKHQRLGSTPARGTSDGFGNPGDLGAPLGIHPLCFPFLRLTPFPWVSLYQVIPSVCWWQSQHSALFAQLQTLLSGERDPSMMLSSVQLGTEAGGARCSARTAPRKGKKTHSISPRGLEGADEAERAGSGPGSSRQRCSWTAP